MAPSVSSGQSANDRLALLSISLQAVPTSLGSPWPPKSAGCCTPCQPLSPNSLNASRNPGDVVTTPFSTVAGFKSPLQLRGATTSALNFADFCEHRFNGIVRGLLEARQLAHAVEPRKFADDEQHVLQRRDIAHGSQPSCFTISGTAVNRSATRP